MGDGALDASNKGFRLLLKMGFDGNIVDPVMIAPVKDRTGLGSKATAKVTEPLVPRVEVSDFRNVESRRRDEVRMRRDVITARDIIEQFDERDGKCRTSLWPNQNDELSSLSVKEQLELVTKYLRDEYNYCIWCACKYDSLQDFQSNCPGEYENH